MVRPRRRRPVRVRFQPFDHPYGHELIAAFGDRAQVTPLRRADADVGLDDVDIFHLGWPEYLTGSDPDAAGALAEKVRGAGLPIVWSQHNLLPHHDRSPAAMAMYAVWAQAADVVVHHSRWGEAVARGRLPYRTAAHHVVHRLGSWESRYRAVATLTRAEAESRLGWRSGRLRLAVIGAPRADKHVQTVLDAFAATDRDDLELSVRVGGDESIPDDPRINTETGRRDEFEFAAKLKAVDAVILPFDVDGSMLTTGIAADAIGAGTAVIASTWGYNVETFGDAAIRYDGTAADLAQCLASITAQQLERSRRAVIGLRSAHGWAPFADRLLEVYAPQR
ncbi:MAG: hypothetical protein AAF081_07500 [Actinomycetota bacterium]